MSVVNSGSDYGVAQCPILFRYIRETRAAMAAMLHDDDITFPANDDLIGGYGML